MERICNKVREIEQAIRSLDMIEAEIRMRVVQDLATEALDSTEVNETAAAAVGILEDLKGIGSFGSVFGVLETWYDDWEAEAFDIMDKLQDRIIQPIAYEQVISDVEEELHAIISSFGLGSSFRVASDGELQAFPGDSRFQWPQTPLNAEISRTMIRIRWLEEQNAKVMSEITQNHVNRLMRSVPTAEPDIIVKYPGRLQIPTQCLICYGVFGKGGCKKDSTVQHSNCICQNPVYGRRCLARALTQNLCPSVSYTHIISLFFSILSIIGSS